MTALIVERRESSASGSQNKLQNKEGVFDQSLYGFEADMSDVQPEKKVPMNIYESTEEYRVELIVPGFEEDNFTIMLEDNETVTVSADMDVQVLDTDEKLLSRGFVFRSFHHIFELPDDAASGEVEAFYENGVLTLLIAKTIKYPSEIIEEIKKLEELEEIEEMEMVEIEF